jgi:hypothetical protein
MNNASSGYCLFEAHADQGLLQGKQQVTTIRLGHSFADNRGYIEKQLEQPLQQGSTHLPPADET